MARGRLTALSQCNGMEETKPQETQCCEAPRSMLTNYFGQKQVPRGTLGEIWRIPIQIYPQTSIDPKYGAFNLKN